VIVFVMAIDLAADEIRRHDGERRGSTFVPQNLVTFTGLIHTRVGPTGSGWNAPLDNARIQRWLPFQEWWNAVVYRDDRREPFTRENLVTYVTNQDGGAHVDPSMDESYARLKRNESHGWRRVDAEGHASPLSDAVGASLRQIGYEVLRTLAPTSASDLKESLRPGANDPCPCGGGRKWMKCHGRV
jgi:hypothetical protein